MDEYLMTILERFGVPMFVLVVGALGVWKVLSWFGSHVATPLIASHVGMVDQIKVNSSTNTETLNSQAKTLGVQTALLQRVVDIQDEQNTLLREIHAEQVKAKKPGEGQR